KKMEFPNLFSRIKINDMELKNRIVMTAIHLGYTPEGFVTDRLVNFYSLRAKGGVGLIIVGGCPVDEQGSMSGMIRIDNDRYIPGLRRLTNEVKGAGARIASQLYQAGRYVHSSMIGGQKSISASAVRSTFTGETPRAIEPDEIPVVQDRFAEAAVRAKISGFDAVEILGSAGYLISQFLSPLTNLREDRYGGSSENRMRFGLEVAEKVRRAVGDDFPVIMRLAGNDFMKGGNSNKETRIFAKKLEMAGIDLFNITGGWHETRVPQLTMSVPRRAYVYLAQGVKSAVSVPVLASNRINDPCVGEEILRNGEADLVTMARALIADPDLPRKARNGNYNLIYHCVACNQGCFDRIFESQPVTCLVNPRAGMERETEIRVSDRQKKVLVIGGGPSGLKAACTAAQRGHKVTLAEKDKQLGGQLLLKRFIPGRSEIVSVAADLIENLRALGVGIVLSKEVNSAFVKENDPDVVIIATGARPLIPDIKGMKDKKVIMAWDLLSGKIKAGEKVVVVGGNAVGLESAIYLANQGTLPPDALHFLAANRAETWDNMELLINRGNKEVTVVEMLPKYGRDIGVSTRWTIIAELKRLGVRIISGARAMEVREEGLEIERGGKREIIPADSIVIAAGAKPENSLADEIKALGKDLYVIGDANGPGKALDAIREGFLTGLKI
ncbi:MAG TPA: FAD-dependent oxidoreductase, partial [Desulfatiglandales bacterium]|nr:FAD-dependent oxidoreductase [Desulfatiglandales bacterium]